MEVANVQCAAEAKASAGHGARQWVVKVDYIQLKCFKGILNSARCASWKGAARATGQGERFADWNYNWLSTWLRQDRLGILARLCDQPAAGGSVTTARPRGEDDNSVAAFSQPFGQ